MSNSPTIPQQKIDEALPDLQASVSMCFHCFDTLLQNLRLSYPQLHSVLQAQNKNEKPSFLADLGKEGVKCPMFVTWEKKREQSLDDVYDLRGCIGSLSPLPVATALTKYALISALQDTRFNPIHPSELPMLRVAVSLLVKYEPCQTAYDWTVGIHGIIIQFTVDGTSYSATYLPEVAQEQGW
eukprot:CAMPEP_0198143790 /NCGR_PEP_ID=MMETSP1443-20131203/10406_1 /TAXON_ID=186043 /ORGANISM="Entomoneis sp., Strain CCMP2396" /LENGTH=182 /DNA_ID=CAMNT_0043807077 /DNA_START=70 /DNA_END=615 /DNA_ORIENTATION=-